MIANDTDKRAAIVCSHIAKGNLPILRAVKTEPLEPADSGWQFLCDSGMAENGMEAQVWSVAEVLGLDPTLSKYIDLPVDSTITRPNKNSKWELGK